MDFVSFYELVKKNLRVRQELLRGLLKAGGAILLSYLVASTLNAAFVGLLAKPAIEYSPKSLRGQAKKLNIKNNINYRNLRKAVISRNVFNSEGEVPDESEKTETGETTTDTQFDENAKCQKTSLNVELVGTIYLGKNSESLATVKEKGYNIADIYKEGDQIIGQSGAFIHGIFPKKVVINNNGKKECLEFISKKSFASTSPPSIDMGGGGDEEDSDVPPPASSGSTVVLESAYVEESLGPGFSKILEAGRLVPHKAEGKMIGFKLIGVKSGSLWQKAGLSSGDVLTSVNDVSMAQPDQGFAVYQALQDRRYVAK